MKVLGTLVTNCQSQCISGCNSLLTIPRWEFNGLLGSHNHIECLAAGKKDFGTSVVHKRLISQ